MNNKSYNISKKIISLAVSLLLLQGVIVFAFAKDSDDVQMAPYTRKLMDIIKSTPVDDSVKFAQEQDESNDFSTRRLIVKMKNGKIKDIYGAKDFVQMPNGITVLQYKTEAQARYAFEKYKEDENVKYCINDIIREAHTNLITDDTVLMQSEASDETGEYLSWGTTRVGADQFMATLPDADELPEIIVAVLDTGIELSHPHLKDRLVPGYDFINDDDDPSDDNMHGTFCAGIVADATKDNVKIMPVKLMDEYGGASEYLSTDLASVVFAVDNGANIISMSFGFQTKDKENYEYYNDLIAYATDRNVLCVAAMGNYMNNHDVLLSRNIYDLPSDAKNVLSVGATDSDEYLAKFTDYGSDMELVAPGTDIYSSNLGGGYIMGSGTSASAPLVAACAALLLSENPDMTLSEVSDELYERAADRLSPGYDIFSGYGRANLGTEDVKINSFSFGYDEKHISFDGTPYSERFILPAFTPYTGTDASFTIQSTNPQVARIGSVMRFNFFVLEILSAGTTRIIASSTDGNFVTYYDLYVYDEIQPIAVSVKTTPDKTDYRVGELIDTTGLSLELSYDFNNSLTKVITEGFECEKVIFDTVGKQDITVKYRDLSCSFSVNVYDSYDNNEDKTINVEQIALPKDLFINYKESFLLQADITPKNADNKNIIWSTSDKNVATVDENGKVTAVGKGTAVITATTEDGGFTAECEVTVKYSWWQWIMYILLFGFIWM